MTRRKPSNDTLPDKGLLHVAKGRYDTLTPAYDFIPGLLHDSTVGIIYGASGSGKTLYALHLLCSAALARPVFGVTPEKRRGLYVGLEGEASIKARIQAWGAQHGVASNPIDYALGSFHLSDEDDVSALIEHMQEQGTQFVVIDTLSIAMAGLDEIAGQHMTLVIGALHRIKRETGACVVAIAHTGKNEKAGIRGHSSQLGNVDTTIEVEAMPGTEDVTNETPRRARLRKQRDGATGMQFHFRLAPQETEAVNARGERVRSVALCESERFTEWEPQTALTGPKMSKSEREAVDILDALTVRFARLGLEPPTKEVFRRTLKQRGWGSDNASTWRVHFKRLTDKLGVFDDGAMTEAR